MDTVESWLGRIGLGKYASLFVENDIDFDVLADFSDAEWKELGLSIGDVKRLRRALESIGSSAAASPDVVHSPAPANLDTPGWARTASDRRPATLLYVDITGSTALTETLDPEEAHAVLYGAVQLLGETVEAHRGSVGRFMGDGLMALFGIPQAFEAHIREACACALAMQSRIREYSADLDRRSGTSIAVRIGIHAGEVVALRVGDGPDGGWDASGPSVPLAARMEQGARPGTIQLTASTFELVAPWFEARELPSVSVKGFSEPVPVVELMGARNAPAPLADAAFVGRRAELAQIRTGLELCASEQLGHALLVRGEPGIGKTRLTEEATRVARAAGFQVRHTLILDFGQGSRQRPVPAMFLQLLGLEPTASSEARTTAVEEARATGIVSPTEEVFLRMVLDLTLDATAKGRMQGISPAERVSGAQGLLGDLLQRAASKQPVLFVIEDLHWADAPTLGYTGALVQRAAQSGAVVLLTSRPMSDEQQREWDRLARGAAVTVIDLGPLRASEAHQLTDMFKNVQAAMAEAIIERADGNPLFLVHLMQATGRGALDAMPTSVQSLVSASLESLAPGDRRAIEAAAVLGQQFQLDALLAVTGEAAYDPEPLVQQRLLRPQGDGYLFAHALVMEGVLSTLLRPERVALHLKAADWFAESDSSLRAMHLGRAEDPRAAEAFAVASEQLLSTYRFGSARDLASRGLGAHPSNEMGSRLQLALGEALTGLGETADALAAFERAVALEPEDEQLCRALERLAHSYRTLNRYDEALRTMERAEPIAEAAGLSDLLVEIGYRRGDTLCMMAQYEHGESAYERARQHALASGSSDLIGLAYGGLARLALHRGRMATVDQLIDECVAHCSGPSLDVVLGRFAHLGGIASFWLAQFDTAARRFEDAVEKSHLIGDLRQELVARENYAMMLVERGDVPAARGLAKQALRLAEQTGERRHLPIIKTVFTHCLLLEGRHSEAVDHARKVHDECEPADKTFAQLWAIGGLACALAQTDSERLDAVLAEGDEICTNPVFGYGVLRYRLDAIMATVLVRDYESALRQAAALKRFTKPEPLPVPSILIEWAWLAEGVRGDAGGASSVLQRCDAVLTRLREIGWSRAVQIAESTLRGDARN